MTTTISLVDELRPYRERAAAITAAFVALEPGALDDANAFFDELRERFVKPLTAAYESIPVELRSLDREHDIAQEDAISSLITSFAGAWELAVLDEFASGVSVPAGGREVTVHALEMTVAALRYRDRFGPALSGTATP